MKEKIPVAEQHHFTPAQKWALINRLLNLIRAEKDIPIVPPESNPYASKLHMLKGI